MSGSPNTYDDLRPDRVREVQVQLVDGTWVDGWLEVVRRIDGVWSGHVRYSVTTDFTGTYIGWFDERRLRKPPA